MKIGNNAPRFCGHFCSPQGGKNNIAKKKPQRAISEALSHLVLFLNYELVCATVPVAIRAKHIIIAATIPGLTTGATEAIRMVESNEIRFPSNLVDSCLSYSSFLIA